MEWAKAHGAAPAVFTFKLPMGSKIKAAASSPPRTSTAWWRSWGWSITWPPAFEDIQAMTPDQFVRGLVADCHARAFFCGENFTFGAKAAGNPAMLQELCKPLGVEVHVLPMAQYEGKAGFLQPHPCGPGGGRHPRRQRDAGRALRHPVPGEHAI